MLPGAHLGNGEARLRSEPLSQVLQAPAAWHGASPPSCSRMAPPPCNPEPGEISVPVSLATLLAVTPASSPSHWPLPTDVTNLPYCPSGSYAPSPLRSCPHFLGTHVTSDSPSPLRPCDQSRVPPGGTCCGRPCCSLSPSLSVVLCPWALKAGAGATPCIATAQSHVLIGSLRFF